MFSVAVIAAVAMDTDSNILVSWYHWQPLLSGSIRYTKQFYEVER